MGIILQKNQEELIKAHSLHRKYFNPILLLEPSSHYYRQLIPVSNIRLLLFFSERIRPSSGVCCVLILHLCLTLCNPIDCSPPGSSVHRIHQARILEYIAIFLLQRLFLTQGLNVRLLHLLNWQTG